MIQEKIITDFSIYSSKEVIKSSLPLFLKIKDLLSHRFNDGFLDYFVLMIEKYKYIKTLLHKQPKIFYDIYFNTKLRYNDKLIETNSVIELFKKNKRITISGTAGSGKTTLLKHLFLYSLIESYKIPILITLRDLNTDILSIDEYIKTKILANKLAPNTDILEKLYTKGNFLFLFDGYDEINSDVKSKVINDMQSFIDKYPNNSFLITTRPFSNIEYFEDFHNYHIEKLTDLEIREFINQQVSDEKLSIKIIDSINENRETYIESFLSNPLLLTLYIITYSTNSQIPNKKYLFYRRVFDVLYKEHDSATKTGYDRELKVRISQDELEEILKYFAFISFFDNKFNFDKSYVNDKLNIIKQKLDKNFDNNDLIEDLKLSLSLWLEDSGFFSFSHKSLQEYFSALYLVKQKEDIQKQIYQKINDLDKNIDILQKGSFDVSFFLDLCYEMEENNYLEFHKLKVLKQLKEIVSFDCKNYKDFPIFPFFVYGSSIEMSTLVHEFFSLRIPTIMEELLNDTRGRFFIIKDNFELLVDRCILVPISQDDRLIYNDYLKSDFFNMTYKFLEKEKFSTNKIDILDRLSLNKIFSELIIDIDNEILKVQKHLKNNKQIQQDMLDFI